MHQLPIVVTISEICLGGTKKVYHHFYRPLHQGKENRRNYGLDLLDLNCQA